MKAICFVDVEKVEVREVPDAQIKEPTDAVVRVDLAGLCGSDLHVYHGRETGMDVGTVMGHELVGEVVDVGSAVKKIKLGDRVATPFTTNCGECFYCRRGLTCRCEKGQLFGWCSGGQGLEGGQSEYVRISLADGTLFKLPETISDATGLLLGDNLSTGFYCADLAEVSADGAYAVIGCGTVGLLSVRAAFYRGAKTVVAIDPVESRREMAAELGAIAVAPEGAKNQLARLTDGRGADGVMELVGLPAAQQLAFDIIRPGGTMSVIGCHSSDRFSFSPVDAYDKNLTFRTGRCPARHYMDQLADFGADHQGELEQLINREFAIDDAVEAYDIFANRKNGCIKAAIRF